MVRNNSRQTQDAEVQRFLAAVRQSRLLKLRKQSAQTRLQYAALLSYEELDQNLTVTYAK